MPFKLKQRKSGYLLFNEDCLSAMANLSDGMIDLVLADPPYGTTNCKWDSVIPFDSMWRELKRITKPSTPIVLMGNQPFTSTLICSNLQEYRYSWTWDKVNRKTGHLDAKRRPLRITEDVCVFYRSKSCYNPQMTRDGKPYNVPGGGKSQSWGSQKDGIRTTSDGSRYPLNLLRIAADERGTVGRIHPTQKPVALMEYFVLTYSNPGDRVLDFTMGSGTTGVACGNQDRRFLGIELDPKYFQIAEKRISAAYNS